MTITLPRTSTVRYGASCAIMAIETLKVIGGALPPRARGLATEWAALHQADLREAWEDAARHAPLRPIPPLE